MQRLFVHVAAGIALVMACIGLGNYTGVHRDLQKAIADDSRNAGISAYAHWDMFVRPSAIVFDLRGIGDDTRPADVFRLLLQFAQAQQSRTYDKVFLAYKGSPRFVLDGAYFNKLGKENGVENPIYTVRTFAQNVYKTDGTPAFGTWTGGFLGVLGKQLEDHNEFHRQWYLNSLLGAK